MTKREISGVEKSRESSSSANQKVPEDEEELNFSDEEGTYVDGIYIPPPVKPACSYETKGPRLIITKIVNNFFKSYGENQSLGPFHKCFNAIIGPNGSGKSNVIDSILFVFGYRAAKIRCKKVSVLIHNSENYQRVQSATVAVHFALIIDKEGDAYDIVPGSEFVVSRTANRDNSSFYTLNDRKVHFKEVGLLLKKYGIDLDHNRFLILQGEVEEIANMKCKGEGPNEHGMLEYLEDIIGTSRYIKPLLQLHERVDVLTDARSEKANRLKLVKDDLNELKEPMQQAIDFLKTENSIVVFKNIIYQKNVFDSEKELADVEEDKKVVEAYKQELMAKRAEIEKIRKEKEDKLQAGTSKYESLTNRRATLKEAFEKANTKDIEIQATMVDENKKRKKTKELLAQEEKKLIQYQRAPEESEKGIQECLMKEKELSVNKEALEAERIEILREIEIETNSLREKKEILLKEIATLDENVNQTKIAFSVAEQDLKICVRNEESEKEKFESLKTTFENTTSFIRERTNQVAALKAKIPATERSLKDARTELAEAKKEETEIRGEINTKRNYLEETKSSMQASKSHSKVLDSLMQQKRDGNCPGLFGRLGDLGSIDKKYDVSVSTACGPLDNLVTDSVSTATWCIDYLKIYDIGRATFIALEKQEHLRQYANSRIQTPENVPRLYDLIKVGDDRVKTAFYFALRDTLVADEIDQASRIAYSGRRYRVVTLKGELIEITGTMSGGGGSVLRGRMGQSVVVTTTAPVDWERLAKELETLEERFKENKTKQLNLERQINALEPELRQMKIDYETFTKELQSVIEEEAALSAQLKIQESRVKSTKCDKVQEAKLTKIVNEKRAAYEAAQKVAQKLQSKIDELTAEIDKKTVEKISKIDKSIQDITKKIDKLKAEQTRLTVAAKTAKKNITKSTKTIASMQNEIKDYETRLRDMKAQRDEIEVDGQKLLKCIQEIEDELSSENYDFSDIKKEVDNLRKQLNKLKSEGVEVDERLNTKIEAINAIKTTLHQTNVMIDRLKLQEIPEESVGELKKYTKQEIDEQNMKVIMRDLKLAEQKVKTDKPNLNVVQEYREKQVVFAERSKELDEISQKRQEMKGLYDKLREQRKQEFLTGFHTIRLKLKEMYQMITLGGDADFELMDTFDPFTEGIQFNVRPPKKSWKKISNLSGGEKTLSSLALVFALHYYKPSPLYVMDEIDAALDFKNVSIVGRYIKERTKNAQFIIISLRSQMFELGDNLVGIYKTLNTTKSVAIDPRAYDNPDADNHDVQLENDERIQAIENAENLVVPQENVENSQNDAELSKNMEVDMSDSIDSKDDNPGPKGIIEDSFEALENDERIRAEEIAENFVVSQENSENSQNDAELSKNMEVDMSDSIDSSDDSGPKGIIGN